MCMCVSMYVGGSCVSMLKKPKKKAFALLGSAVTGGHEPPCVNAGY